MVSASARVPSWENLRAMVDAGVPAAEPIAGRPPLEMFVDAQGARIGLRAPVDRVEAPPASRYADVRVQLVELHGQPHVEISTAARHLYHEFHALIVVAADLIQLDRIPALTAIAESLARWRQLLTPVSTMEAEERIGLLAELWALRRLIVAHGTSAFDAWVGPRGEPHDLRMGKREIEVKATRSPRRVHVINGLEQLTPSLGCELFVLSLQLEPAGAQSQPLTLPSAISDIDGLLVDDRPRRDLFQWLLREQLGYRPDGDEDEGVILRTAPRLIPVDERCPALTRDLLHPLGDLATRIETVRYTVDLDGLGVEDGTPDFLGLLP